MRSATNWLVVVLDGVMSNGGEVERLESRVRDLQSALDSAMLAIGESLGVSEVNGPAAGMLVLKRYRESIALLEPERD